MPDTWTSDSRTYLKPPAQDARDPWIASTASAGRVGTQQLLEVTEVDPPPAVAEALGSDDWVIVRRRLILLDGTPVELADSYYPLDIARDTPLAEHRKIKGGAPRILAELGYAPRAADEDISARLPDRREQDLLGIGQWEPVLDMLRAIRSQDRPVEVTVMTKVGALSRLHYELTVD
jgi:DNA-binding GntR family transcriptional regulator